MNRLKYYFMRYRPYAMAIAFFLLIFVIWGLGVWWGFPALDSLLVGILVFLVASALYLLLLYRGVGEKHDVEALLIQNADDAVLGAAPEDREEVSLLRERLLDALERMKKGQGRKRDLLYRLPWYLVIGQPAVGKSTLVYRSGLGFPFADRENARVAGVGGTRHCDWFFSSEAVLLDTAGRYVSDQDEVGKWRAFLELLQRHRPRRPLNGLIVVVSADELIGSDAAARDALARRLRERLQETHELLGTALPIYLVFTKSDLIPGFRQFHAQLDPAQRDEVLGMTFPHQDFATADWAARFSSALARLVTRCRTIGEQRLIEGDVVRTREEPAALEFPLELQALSPVLSGFVGALLQANPYQSAPLLRGFYFTSALADGQPRERRCAAELSWVAAREASRCRVSSEGVPGSVWGSLRRCQDAGGRRSPHVREPAAARRCSTRQRVSGRSFARRRRECVCCDSWPGLVCMRGCGTQFPTGCIRLGQAARPVTDRTGGWNTDGR